MRAWQEGYREDKACRLFGQTKPLALAVVAALGVQPEVGYPAFRFDRTPPAGFSGDAVVGIERTLMFRDRVVSGVVWVETAQAGRYTLTPQSTGALRRVLIDAGFDREASDAYVRQPYHEAGAATCLPLESARESCLEFTLEPVNEGSRKALATQATAGDAAPFNGGLLELRLPQDAHRKLIPEQIVSEPSAVGYATLYGSVAESEGGRSSSIGTVQRGILSKGAGRFEYDFSAMSMGGGHSAGSSTKLQYNTLAAGFRHDGGTAYSGMFRAASGGQAFGLSTGMFFTKPLQLGVAWQSSNGNLSSFSQKQRVRLQLTSSSYVRILSSGVQLFEGQLPAGDQWVVFGGFSEPFVDVVVRGVSGRETTIRAETQPIDEPVAILPAGADKHLWYFDAGRIVRNDGADNRHLDTLDGMQASASYAHLFDLFSLSVGGQVIGDLKRVSTSSYDRHGRWRVTAMAGSERESAINLGMTPRVGDLFVGGSFTRYLPPRKDGALSENCRIETLSICPSSNTRGYRAWNASLGYRGFPLTLGVNVLDDGVVETTRYLATYSVSPSVFRGATLMALGSYDPDSGDKALMLNVSIPLSSGSGSATVNNSYSDDFKGNRGLTSGYSQSFGAEGEYGVRGISATVAGSRQPEGSSSHAASAYVTSQLGAVSNSLAASVGSGGGRAINTAFSTQFGASSSGMAFARDNQGIPVSDLFSGSDYAGISVLNRSQEVQTVQVGAHKLEVAANSNVLIPVSQGVVKNVTVSPGPISNPDEASAPRTLFKGNLKTITVEDGFWIVARFRNDADPAKPLIPARHTFKRPNEQVERLNPDRKGAAMLFEFKESGDRIERFVIADSVDDQYRCSMNADEIPTRDDAAIYKEIVYSCEPWQDPYKGRKTTPTMVVEAGSVQQQIGGVPGEIASRVDDAHVGEPDSSDGHAQSEKTVRERVERWKKAWMSGNLTDYFAAYDASFEPEKGSRPQWERQRRERISAQSNIQLQLHDVQIRMADGYRAVVNFKQKYRSEQYSDVTVKSLELIRGSGGWRIARERVLATVSAGG